MATGDATRQMTNANSRARTTTHAFRRAFRRASTKRVETFAAVDDRASADVGRSDEEDVRACRTRGADERAFTSPSPVRAGARARVYVNTANSDALRHAGKVTVVGGCNGWRCGAYERGMTEVRGTTWMKADIDVDANAYEMAYVFKNDGTKKYENNNSHDFTVGVEYGPTKEEFEEILKLNAVDEAARAEADAEVNREMSMASSNTGAGAKFEKYGRTIVRTATGEPLVSGTTASVFWNKAQNPIGGADVESLVMHVGYNEWIRGVEEKVPMRRASGQAQDVNNDWWVCDVPVSPTACVLNFVISDVEEKNWDNNEKQNFRVAVKNVADDEMWANIRELRFEEKRIAALRAIKNEKDRLARRAAEAAKAKQLAIEVGLKQQAFIIYTEPKVPQAGQPLKVFYNKKNTNLNWSGDIYMTSGFNRWRHAGAPAPMKMTPPKEGEEFFTAVVPIVPNDSWMADFVFSSGIGQGAQYDNRGGRDYHLPVTGGDAKKPPLHVVHIAVEMAPIAKVGGLADVVTAIGRVMKENGHQVEVILPKYQFFNNSVLLGGRQYETHFDWAGTTIRVEKCIVEGLQCFFIEPQNNMFSTNAVYGRNDDGERFNFFCNAALEFLNRTARQPDILHCHDWSSAEVARAYWQHYHHNGMPKPKVAFTIHNMNYGQAKLSEAVFHSQMTTTVSRSYAGEVSGSPVVSGNLQKFYGVRNGIDPDIWDPEIDSFLPVKYNAENCVEGKAAARAELRSRLGMSGWNDKPIVGVVSRLTAQKGVHLIKHAAHHTLSRGGQFVLLGSAPDPKIQAEFNGLANQLAGQDSGFFFAFDEPLSHLMYAGCDIILVPSMFEPCGLTQMISMRYGAVPVVRATGGLRDTVFDVDNEKERAAWEIAGSSDWKTDGDVTNGFSFEGTDAGALNYALDRCLDAFYNDRAWFRSLQKRDMLQDWSWNKPALEYEELYYKCIGQ